MYYTSSFLEKSKIYWNRYLSLSSLLICYKNSTNNEKKILYFHPIKIQLIDINFLSIIKKQNKLYFVLINKKHFNNYLNDWYFNNYNNLLKNHVQIFHSIFWLFFSNMLPTLHIIIQTHDYSSIYFSYLNISNSTTLL
jgi:hypothetical protein